VNGIASDGEAAANSSSARRPATPDARARHRLPAVTFAEASTAVGCAAERSRVR